MQSIKAYTQNILIGRPEVELQFEDLNVDGKTVNCGLDYSHSGQASLASFCDSDNEASGSIKDGVFIDWLRNY
jgi:hypothetical protein